MSRGKGTDTPALCSPSPALQVIVLGAGGGPQEANTTAFLVRSTAEGWRRGSIVALDAGVLLSSITRILEQTLPPGLGAASSSGSDSEECGSGSGSPSPSPSPSPSSMLTPPLPLPLPLPYTLTSGPFAGLEVPNATAAANASHIQNTLINTYLITHPHLDHIAGFVVNTAGLPGSRPKRLAGLPSTISAFKQHIFNNVIWPNLSDENNGAGLVTYMRLVDGGSPALGTGDGRGYVEISDGLAVKVWSVSHGHCIERHSHRGSGASSRYGSIDAGSGGGGGLTSPRLMARQTSFSTNPGLYSSPLSHQLTLPHQGQHQRRESHAVLSGLGGAAAARRASQAIGMATPPPPGESACVYDSSAYFIRDVTTGREVLMFGDVEPDSISLSPRNIHVWQEAAPKIAAGHLAAIFMECSYDDSQPLDRLYGHLTPRHVVDELTNLADEVATARAALKEQQQQQRQQRQQRQRERERERDREDRKRKRRAADEEHPNLTVGITAGSRTGSRTGSRSRRKTDLDMDASADSTPPTTTEAKSNSAGSAQDEPVSPRTVYPPWVGSSRADDSSASTPGTAATTVTTTVTTTTTTARTARTERTERTERTATPHISTPTADLSLNDADHPFSGMETGISGASRAEGQDGRQLPLKGLKIVIIHVKEKLKDGPTAGETILDQLLEYEEHSPLGCEYIISYAGQSLYV